MLVKRGSQKGLGDAWVLFHPTYVVNLAWWVRFWKKFTFNRAQDVVRKPLVYSAHLRRMLIAGKPFQFCTWNIARKFCSGRGWGGMSYWVYVTLSCHNWKSNDFRYSGACFIYQFCVLHKYVLVGYSRHKKKTTFIGGMELVSLRCNRDFTSASSYGLGWYKYAIATQWYQFHTTDAWWFSLNMRHYGGDELNVFTSELFQLP